MVPDGKARKALISVSPPDADGICVMTFARPHKLNGWNFPLLAQKKKALQAAAADDAVKAVIITGSGRYYSAGAAFHEMISLMLPSALLKMTEDVTHDLFDSYLSFDKPLFAAVNGPAVGGGCTSLLHFDVVIASSRATFLTPFNKLGLPPEGCSPLTFPSKMGTKVASLMLDEGCKLTAREAKDCGLVDVLVADENEPTEVSRSAEDVGGETGELMVLARARQVAVEWLQTPPERRQRRPSHGRTDEFRVKNRQEARALAKAVLSPAFFNAQYDLAKSKGKPAAVQTFFWIACLLRPILAAGDVPTLAFLGGLLAAPALLLFRAW